MSRHFPSKVDSWYYFVFGSVAFALLASGVAVWSQGIVAALAVLVPVTVVALGLPVWLLKTTCYTLEPTRLLVRSGPFSWNVPLAGIHSITPTRNPLSSPALSLDRLCIEYGKHGSLMISPADKQGFLRELETLRAQLPR